MIGLYYDNFSFQSRIIGFPQQVFNTKVALKHTMAGTRRTLIQSPAVSILTVLIRLLTIEKYEQLRTFVKEAAGNMMILERIRFV
jgi:hypothetical protein